MEGQILLTLILITSVILLSPFRGLRPLAVVASLILSLRYILWRGLYTLNTVDAIGLSISLILLLSEAYGIIQSILFYYQSLWPVDREPPSTRGWELPTVDIFIPIFNEPKEILYRTVIGCQAQEYPEDRVKIHILDDGGREEIREMALRLGCNYIRREDRRHAKAGNLNHALKLTEGDLIAIFDCDHVPTRNFLKETVAFFRDEKVAIVQTPHHFYNPDIFQKNLRMEREIANEQDLFFHVIQPGRDRYNSAFFAGSGGIFRRKYLEGIGGFRTETVTEDIHTSMELHGKGYTSIFYNRDLSAGLAPESYESYLKQRRRWATGGIQIFLSHNPLFKRGLSFHQRLNYLASIIYFFHGLPRVVYLTAPLSYLFLGYAPLVADLKTLLHYFLAHYIASTIAFNYVGKGYRNPFWSDVYEAVMAFGLTATVLRTLTNPRTDRFDVTPKGEVHREATFSSSMTTPHIVVLFLLFVAILLGAFLPDLYIRDALIISMAWAGYNMLILGSAILAALERPQRRRLIRLSRRIKVELRLKDGRTFHLYTKDISETGLSAVATEPLEIDDPEVSLSLISDYGEVTHLKGRVMRNDRKGDGTIHIGISFVNVDEESYRGIIRQMYSPPNSWEGLHRAKSGIFPSMKSLILSPLRAFLRERVLKRFSPRVPLSLPCRVETPSGAIEGRTVDISYTGMSIRLDKGIDPGDKIMVRIDGHCLKAIPVWQRRSGGWNHVGVRFSDPSEGVRLWRGLKA